MSLQKLGLIHTSATLVAIFQNLCDELLPGVEVFNIADDSLIKDVIANGSLQPSVSRRLGCHVHCAELAGADRIMVTCSSVGEAVEAMQPFCAVPLLRVDQPMADLAVSSGKRIGVLATLSTTLLPTASLIERRAKALGTSITLESRVCDGAFEALMCGNSEKHDHLVLEHFDTLAASVDVIVLAQASMSRLITPELSERIKTPILSSPRLAINSLVAHTA